MSVEADCYRAKIRIQRESELDTSHDFEVSELSIVDPESKRTVTNYTKPFERRKENA